MHGTKEGVERKGEVVSMRGAERHGWIMEIVREWDCGCLCRCLNLGITSLVFKTEAFYGH